MTEPIAHDVRLVLGADQLEATTWDSYDITLDMLSAGSAWTFSFWRSGQWDDIKARTRIGDPVVVTIDGAAQLVGRIDTWHLPTDRGDGARMIIAGRDYAGAAISADADPTLVLRNVTLQDALTRLFAPLGFTVSFGAGVDPVRVAHGVRAQRFRRTPRAQHRELIDRVRPRVGEKIWQIADALCRRAGYLLWTAPGDGTAGVTLRVDVPATGQPVFAFTRREALGRVDADSIILESDYSFDGTDVPSTVTVFGESAQGDARPSRIAREVTNGFLLSPDFARGRVSPDRPPQPSYQRSARARTPASARAEAARVLCDKNADFCVYKTTVKDHGQRVGGDVLLYQPNTVAAVTDTLADLDRAPFLATRVQFRGSRAGGRTTQLRMVPRGVLVLDPGAA